MTWLGIGAIGGPYFGRIEEVSEIDLAAFLPKNSESTKVNEQLPKFRDEDTLPAIVVYSSKRPLTQTQLDTVSKVKESLAKVDGVAGEIGPVVQSDDKKAALLVLPIGSDQEIASVLGKVRNVLDENKSDQLQSTITGPAGFAADLNKAFAGIDGLLLITAFAVVFVILIVVYRSVLLPILVLSTSILALCASIFAVWWLAKQNVIALNGQVQGILFILVIGAATDYSLLYVSRFREALYEKSSRYDATVTALRGSIEPILASGGTVIVGLLCLLLSELQSNTALGPVGALGIVFAMLSALTFLPAVLLAFGRVGFWPLMPSTDKKAVKAHKAKLDRSVWRKVGGFVERRPRPIWIASTAVLLVAAAFSLQIKASGVAQTDLVLGYSEAREGQNELDEHFPGGTGSPALVITKADTYESVVKTLDGQKGVDGVSVVADGVEAGFKPLGREESRIKSEIRTEVQKKYDEQLAMLNTQFADLEAVAGPQVAASAKEQAIAQIPTVESIVDEAYPFKDAVVKNIDGEVLLQVTLSNPPDSSEAKQTVRQLRSAVSPVDNTALIGGPTAVQLDTTDASIRDRTVIIPIVLVAITIILMILLRAIVAPLLLLLSTIISFGAALGVAALLFNHVWDFPGADPSVVLFAFVFLVALGIDYNIFLMTRVREETIKHGTARGIIKGLVVTGGVITSAGIVLAATFAALGVIPILFLFQLAFIVAFGVVLDTFVVRSLLVPALIRDIGPFVWWPSKLSKKK